MKKIINSKIIDTDTGVEVAGRTSARSHGNNPIGREHIILIDGIYYLQTVGGNDIYSPEDDLEEIGCGVHDALLPYVAEHEEWVRNTDLIEHVASALGQSSSGGRASCTRERIK